MRKSVWIVGLGLALWLTSVDTAQATTLNFDSIVLAPGGACADGTAYLNSFGINFVSVSGGATPQICNVTGTSVTATSPGNTFAGAPAVTNTDLSYDLLFATPLVSLSFSRATVDAHTAIPPWSAFAYDAGNNLLDSIVESLRFPGPPAAVFTLSGAGITRLRFAAFNSAHVTFNHPHLDDLVLTEAPEPGSLVLLGTGLIAAAAAKRRKSRLRRSR